MHFFSGSWNAKLDEKGRFVLPSSLRYGLVEDGEIQVFLGLGLGGCLAIYKRSDVESMVRRFQKKQHLAKYQPFFTTFFSSLQKISPDKVGRVTIPGFLRQAAGIGKEIIIAGVIDKLEIWPEEVHEKRMQAFVSGEEGGTLAEEAFALLGADEEDLAAPKGSLESLMDACSRKGAGDPA
ncbi:MAG: hypothetical protein AAGI90_04630 [Chlamydiota bacterium]